MKKDRLEVLRARIDSIDDRIAALLVRRGDCASEIGRAKKEKGRPVRDAVREERVLKRVRTAACGAMTKKAVERIYLAILDECRSIQMRMPAKKGK